MNRFSLLAFGWLGFRSGIPGVFPRGANQNQRERHIICEFRGYRMVGCMLHEDDQVPKCQNISVRQSIGASRL